MATLHSVKRGCGLDRQYAVVLNSRSDSENDDGGDNTFCLEDIVKCLSARYTDTDWEQYEPALCQCGIEYLNVAAQYPWDYYTNPAKIGMTNGDATIFWEWAMGQMVQWENVKQKRKEDWMTMHKKKARLSSPKDNENDENMAPVALSFQS